MSNAANDSIQVYQFADNGFSYSQTISGADCGNGSTATALVTAAYPLPRQAADPIVHMDGTSRQEFLQPCPVVIDNKDALDRTGD